MTHEQIIATYGDLVRDAAKRHGLRDSLIFAEIAQESSGNSQAVSGANCRGLMQLSKGALTDYNVHFKTFIAWDDIFSPDRNIEVGSWYLARMISQLKNEILGIRAYNQGAGTVRKDPSKGTWYSDGVLNKELEFRTLLNETDSGV